MVIHASLLKDMLLELCACSMREYVCVLRVGAGFLVGLITAYLGHVTKIEPKVLKIAIFSSTV